MEDVLLLGINNKAGSTMCICVSTASVYSFAFVYVQHNTRLQIEQSSIHIIASHISTSW